MIDKTIKKRHQNILRSAQKLFAKQGFAATSIAQIANRAKVPASLIYHYYEDKEALWRAVKEAVLLKLGVEQSTFPSAEEGLKACIEWLVSKRIEIYSQSKDLVRLMQWQALEPEQQKLFSQQLHAPTQWVELIEALQQSGELRRDWEVRYIIFLIATLSAAPFLGGNEEIVANEKARQIHQGRVIELLLQVLAP